MAISVIGSLKTTTAHIISSIFIASFSILPHTQDQGRARLSEGCKLANGITTHSENSVLSAKPVLGPGLYVQPVSTDAARAPIPQPVPPPPHPHGYGDSGLDTQSNIHPHLRPSSSGLVSDMMQRGNSSTSEELGPVSGSPTAPPMAAQGILGEHDDSVTDGRKANRELSQSKRAVQNRAAQVRPRFYCDGTRYYFYIHFIVCYG